MWKNSFKTVTTERCKLNDKNPPLATAFCLAIVCKLQGGQGRPPWSSAAPEWRPGVQCGAGRSTARSNSGESFVGRALRRPAQGPRSPTLSTGQCRCASKLPEAEESATWRDQRNNPQSANGTRNSSQHHLQERENILIHGDNRLDIQKSFASTVG